MKAVQPLDIVVIAYAPSTGTGSSGFDATTAEYVALLAVDLDAGAP